MNADHNNLTKFSDRKDTNYRTVRNRLAKTMADIRKVNCTLSDALFGKRPDSETVHAQLDTLRTYLKIETDPADALSKIPDVRVEGSCRWLTDETSFKNWLSSPSPRYYWLEGSPGAGKTMLSTHLIEQLDNAPTCFHFFGGGENSSSNLGSFLSSMAYQMAVINPGVRNALLILVQQGTKLNHRNFRSLWQTIFVGCIFRQKLKAT